MIPKLKFTPSKNKASYKGTDAEFKEFCTLFEKVDDFKKFPVYFDGTNCLISCFDGYEWHKHQPKLVDYGYGLTVKSIEKYIETNYGSSNSKNYLIEAGLMSFEYEKPWKQGSYVDLDGTKTGWQFEDFEDGRNGTMTIQGTEDDAEIEGQFITFSVYELNEK